MNQKLEKLGNFCIWAGATIFLIWILLGVALANIAPVILVAAVLYGLAFARISRNIPPFQVPGKNWMARFLLWHKKGLGVLESDRGAVAFVFLVALVGIIGLVCIALIGYDTRWVASLGAEHPARGQRALLVVLPALAGAFLVIAGERLTNRSKF